MLNAKMCMSLGHKFQGLKDMAITTIRNISPVTQNTHKWS